MTKSEAWDLIADLTSDVSNEYLAIVIEHVDRMLKRQHEAETASEKPVPKPAPVEAAKEPQQSPPPAASKKKLDDGKILALRDAGWTLEKIGDEMGVSGRTISNHLSAMGKTGQAAEVTDDV